MAHLNGLIPASALTALSVGGHLLAVPARAFEEWRRRAAAAGRVLTITSVADAYRVLAVQERVFLQRYIPQATGGGIYGDVRWYRGVRYVRRHGAAAAIPGTSNHGRGLAVDIANAGRFGGAFHDWMLATGPELGWSNTEGRSVGEPWHWVHDGVTLAGSGAGVSTGLKPAPPITIAPIPTLSEEDTDMPHYLRVTEGSTAGDIWEVGEFTADKLTFQDYTDLRSTIDPRLKGVTPAGLSRIVERVSARRLHVFGPDKKGK